MSTNRRNTKIEEKKIPGFTKFRNAVLFIVWPFPIFLKSLSNFKSSFYRKIIILFGFMYGLTYLPIANSDGSRYAQYFDEIDNYSIHAYVDDISKIFSSDARYPDIYAYSLFFAISKITDNVQIFHGITALIYFIAFIGLLFTIYNLNQANIKKFYFVFFLGCVFIQNFSAGINGVRFPLGFVVFSYGVLNFFITNNKKYWIFVFLSPLIHFALLYPVLILLLYSIVPIKSRNSFLIILLITAGIGGTILQEFIRNNISFFGEAFENKLLGYTNELYILNREEHVTNWNWYVILNHYGPYYFSVITLILVLVFRKKFIFDELATKLFSFGYFLLFASFISGGLVDTITNRYAIIVNLFTLIFLSYLSSLNVLSKELKLLSRLYLPILLLHSLVILRADLYTVSPLLLIGNPILIFFIKANQSIQSFLLG